MFGEIREHLISGEQQAAQFSWTVGLSTRVQGGETIQINENQIKKGLVYRAKVLIHKVGNEEQYCCWYKDMWQTKHCQHAITRLNPYNSQWDGTIIIAIENKCEKKNNEKWYTGWPSHIGIHTKQLERSIHKY